MRSMILESDATALDLLLEKIYRDTGHDFRGYKRGTITRRLERRLHATGTRNYLQYMQFLDAHPEESQQLADYLTIAVSGFFRNPYAFQQVVRLVLPELVSHRRTQGEQNLRLWSTACARGEEPYSIAILLADFLGLGNRLRDFDIAIYATDINRRALAEARVGRYSPKNVENLPHAILESYFTRNDGGYMVNSNVGQMLHLSYFDLTSTTQPPFMELDCIFCCNVLIYLQAQLQERVLNMLYESLAVPGYLILGETETLTGNLCKELECLDTKAKTYKKNGRSVHV